MTPFVTLVKFSDHPSSESPNPTRSPNTIIQEMVSSRGGKINCSIVTAGRYDAVVVAEFDNLIECLQAWLPAKFTYGWSTETLPGLPSTDFDKLYANLLREAQTSQTKR